MKNLLQSELPNYIIKYIDTHLEHMKIYLSEDNQIDQIENTYFFKGKVKLIYQWPWYTTRGTSSICDLFKILKNYSLKSLNNITFRQ